MIKWLQANWRYMGVAIVFGAGMAIVLSMPQRNPTFVCSADKHFEFRYVDNVATLGCFE